MYFVCVFYFLLVFLIPERNENQLTNSSARNIVLTVVFFNLLNPVLISYSPL